MWNWRCAPKKNYSLLALLAAWREQTQLHHLTALSELIPSRRKHPASICSLFVFGDFGDVRRCRSIASESVNDGPHANLSRKNHHTLTWHHAEQHGAKRHAHKPGRHIGKNPPHDRQPLNHHPAHHAPRAQGHPVRRIRAHTRRLDGLRHTSGRLRQNVPGTMGARPSARHEGPCPNEHQTQASPSKTRHAQQRHAQMRHDNAAVTAAGRATSSAGYFGFSGSPFLGRKWWS
jgi:hypothetical protein